MQDLVLLLKQRQIDLKQYLTQESVASSFDLMPYNVCQLLTLFSVTPETDLLTFTSCHSVVKHALDINIQNLKIINGI